MLFLITLSYNWSWSCFSWSHSIVFPCSQICARILQNSGSMSYSSFIFSVASFSTDPSIRTCLVWGKLSAVLSNHKNTIEAWGFSSYTQKIQFNGNRLTNKQQKITKFNYEEKKFQESLDKVKVVKKPDSSIHVHSIFLQKVKVGNL